MPAAKSYSYICNSTSVERCSFICKTTGRIIDSVIKTEDMIGFLLANLIFCEINRRFYGILILGWTYIDTQGWGGGGWRGGKVKSNLYIAGRPGVGGMGGGPPWQTKTTLRTSLPHFHQHVSLMLTN